jgi:hypothetical protein
MNPFKQTPTETTSTNRNLLVKGGVAAGAGALAVVSALGLSHNAGNAAPAPSDEAVPAAQVVVPGTVLEAKPVATPEPGPVETIKPTSPEPVATEAPAPAVEHQDKPAHHESTPPVTTNTSAPEMMPDDTGLLASNGTPSPTEAPTSPAPEIIPDDSGMLPPSSPPASQ